MNYAQQIIQHNTLTLARAILALSVLGTLVFTPLADLFPGHHLERLEANAEGLTRLNFFLFWGNLAVGRLLAIAVLLLVMAGVYPRFTCWLHAWLTYSYFYGMLIVEGGDQINAILTLLLIPLCILDPRPNAWRNERRNERLPAWLYLNGKYAAWFIAIQMAVLYLNAGVAKAFATEWYNGTAVYYWFNDHMFGAPQWLRAGIGFLFVHPVTVSLINWGVIALEVGLFTALFLARPYKYRFFALAFAFHFSIVLVHGLMSFWLAMTGGLILFLFRLDTDIITNLRGLRDALRPGLPAPPAEVTRTEKRPAPASVEV